MAARYVRIGQYPDYHDEIRGTLLEILASTANPGTYAAPEDVAGCTLEMGADGLWTGNLGTLTQAQANALVAAGVMGNVKTGTPAEINGNCVQWTGTSWREMLSNPVVDITKVRSGLKLYDIQNDRFQRETAIHISPEGIVPLSAGGIGDLAKLRINGHARMRIKRTANNSSNKHSETIPIAITIEGGNKLTDSSINLTTTKLSSVPATSFRPVFIGDSITAVEIAAQDGTFTASYGISSALREYFVRDSVDGTLGTCTVLGTKGLKTATTQYRGSARTLRAMHEGRSGWAAATYLRHPVLLTASASASTASLANGAASWAFLGLVTASGAWSGSDAQKNLIRTTRFSNATAWDYNADLWDYLKLRPGWTGSGSWVNNPTNRGFIDAAMVAIKAAPDNPFWTGSGDQEFFNPFLWTIAYKTMDTSLNRLIVGSTAGTLITAETINNYDVIDGPTHFFLEVGENDRWQFGSPNLSDTVADIKKIVDGINKTYAYLGVYAPKIALIFSRGTGKFDPMSEPNVESPKIVSFSGSGLTWKQDLSDALKGLGCTVLDADLAQDPASAANFSSDPYEYTDRGDVIRGPVFDNIHPGISALRGIAYQCYAWMLSTAVY